MEEIDLQTTELQEVPTSGDGAYFGFLSQVQPPSSNTQNSGTSSTWRSS